MTSRARAILAVALAAVLIGSTLWLLRTGASDRATTLTGTAGRHAVRVVVAAAVVGVRAVDIEVSEPSGVTGVRLEPAMTDMGHAYAPLTAAPVDKQRGRYRADLRFDMSGRWELTVVVDDGTGTERVRLPLTVTG